MRPFCCANANFNHDNINPKSSIILLSSSCTKEKNCGITPPPKFVSCIARVRNYDCLVQYKPKKKLLIASFDTQNKLSIKGSYSPSTY